VEKTVLEIDPEARAHVLTALEIIDRFVDHGLKAEIHQLCTVGKWELSRGVTVVLP
jgi:hypothetical protein